MRRIKLLVCVICTLVFMASLVGCKAPEPSVKEGKFNFSVTYEVDGEIKTISSVFVCKFKEAGKELGGYYVSWDSYIEDKEIESLFPKDRHNCIVVAVNQDGTIYLDLNLHAKYFMSDPSYEDPYDGKPYMYIMYNDAVAEEKGTYGDTDAEVLESYGVKLISYEYDKPVKNTYK